MRVAGTKGFYAPEQVHVLDGNWIDAEFEDGHIGGRGIFGHEVNPDSSLTFRAVYTVLD